MVEAYHPAGQIDAASRRIWRTSPADVPGLRSPSPWRSCRSCGRRRAGPAPTALPRRSLAREAEHALQAERGRIATEIHEGVVQDLAGAAYELHAAATLPMGTPEDQLRGALGRGADVCRRTMTRMRELLVDLRSEEHRVQDLQSAIEAIARPLRDAGVEVIVGLALSRPLPGETALLVHRAAREILLDVRRRPDVTLVTMKIEERDDQVTLTVDHNLMPGPRDGDERENGHRPRLDSLAQTLRDRGGSLAIDAREGVSARYAATVPPPVSPAVQRRRPSPWSTAQRPTRAVVDADVAVDPGQWARTVGSVMPSRRAIVLLGMPSATSSRTSRSRSLSTLSGSPAAERATTVRAIRGSSGESPAAALWIARTTSSTLASFRT